MLIRMAATGAVTEAGIETEALRLEPEKGSPSTNDVLAETAQR